MFSELYRRGASYASRSAARTIFDLAIAPYSFPLSRIVRSCDARSIAINPKRSFQPSAHSKLSTRLQWKYPRTSNPRWIDPCSARSV